MPAEPISILRGERLDHYLVRTGHAASRRDARELVERGSVRLNGRRGIKGALVRAGDTVEVEALPGVLAIEPDPRILPEIVFEDAAALVVNKAGAIPCYPLRAGERGTVMNAIVAAFPETALAGDSPLEGGLVHRLDNGTSGALIVARTPDAFARLRSAIRTGAVMRRYQAVVAGMVKNLLRLDWPIAHHPRNPRRMLAATDPATVRRLGAREAETLVEAVRSIGSFTLLNVFPATGSRHQIRVHLAKAGHPIVGDKLYGGPLADEFGSGRFLLHLADVQFDSPASGRVAVHAPVPLDMLTLITGKK